MTPLIKSVLLMFIWSSLQLGYSAAKKDNVECLTPTREAGICIHLDHCTVLYDLHKDSYLSQDDRAILNLSQCGYDNNTVSVCCPTQIVDERADGRRLIGTRSRSKRSREIIIYDKCVTPNQEPASCIELVQCEYLYNLLQDPHLTRADNEYLKRSQCGHNVNQNILVCCPIKTEVKRNSTYLLTTTPSLKEITKETAINTSCITPNQENASCIELEQCQYLFNLMQDVNLTEDNKQFLRRSQCGYENKKILICCPDYQRFVLKSQPTSSTAQPAPTSILPTPPYCGLALSNRIYGGSIAGLDEFPWLALVEHTLFGTKGFNCGGALINNRYVITAAHCYKKPKNGGFFNITGVRLGEYDLRYDPDCEIDVNGKSDCNPGHVDVNVEKVVAHSRFDPDSSSKQHDIALLRLARVVVFSNSIKSICLPSFANLHSNNFTGTAMSIAGWGKTERVSVSNLKLKATVNVCSLKNCQDLYNTKNINLQSTHMCAGGDNFVDSCSGDSGGPLMMQIHAANFSAFFVVGIVSFGPKPCGTPGWPAVYTRVGSYINWIQGKVLP